MLIMDMDVLTSKHTLLILYSVIFKPKSAIRVVFS